MKKVAAFFGFIVNVITIGNVLVYFIWAPSVNWLVCLICVIAIAIFNAGLYHFLIHNPSLYKNIRRISIVVIALHLFFSVYAQSFVHFVKTENWYRARFTLNKIEDGLIEYYKENDRFPENLSSLNLYRMPIDPYSNEEGMGYVLLNNRSCVIYSIGPDGKNDKGEVALAEDAIKYAVYVHPWRVMYFGEYLYDLTDYKRHLMGDMVKKIER